MAGSAHDKLVPEVVELRNKTKATIFPVKGGEAIPKPVLEAMRSLFNYEIERGDTYPLEECQDFDTFVDYWTSKFCAVMVEGEVKELADDSKLMGTFYIKPNFVGRSSHISNAGFLVNPDYRGFGIGTALGKQYIQWAPKLGYVYSMFNLVYVTNTASLKIWDGLGFERIGRIKGAGRLKSSKELVDAIQFGMSFS